MKALKVILVSGKAQSGKDTTAKELQKKLMRDNHSVLVTHYADLLKFICTNYFGWNGVKDEEGRQMLQHVGTDIIRKQNPTLWVDFVAMMLKYFHDNWEYVIIPDCRFPNEITTLIKNGFDIIHLRVTRQGFESSLTEEQRNHPSEIALDDIAPDYYVDNSGTPEELSGKIELWIKENLYENRL